MQETRDQRRVIERIGGNDTKATVIMERNMIGDGDTNIMIDTIIETALMATDLNIDKKDNHVLNSILQFNSVKVGILHACISFLLYTFFWCVFSSRRQANCCATRESASTGSRSF
jgi:hypothetical protein